MGSILTATVVIEGVRPALWHYFGREAIPLERGERTGVAGNDPEEWRRTVLMTRERQLYFDPTMIFGTIRDGAVHTKQGRGTLQPKVVATLQVVSDIVLVDRFVPDEPIPEDREAPVYMDVRSVKNPASKARNVRYRVAASPGWKAEFRIAWDKTIVDRVQMQTILNDAGTFCGLGDGRRIGFGRFDVNSYEVTEA